MATKRSKPRLLVTGASGFLGTRLPALAAERFEVLAVSRSKPTHSLGDARWQSLDLADASALAVAIASFSPDAVIHAAAAQAGELSSSLESVNVLATGQLASWCASVGARFVFVSSDMVHSGDDAPYPPGCEPTPTSEYGRSKANGEAAAFAGFSNSAGPDEAADQPSVVRTSLIYGTEEMDRGTKGMAERLNRGGTLTLWDNVIRQPVEISALSRGLISLASGPGVGHINLVGERALSRADFALEMLRHWEIDIDGMFSDQISRIVVGPDAGVPLDLRMTS